MIASARPCPPEPPRNLHGTEGVDGSGPSEGLAKILQMPFILPTPRVADGDDLSPEHVPNVRPVSAIWLEQTAGSARSTSFSGRASIVRSSERLPRSAWRQAPGAPA